MKNLVFTLPILSLLFVAGTAKADCASNVDVDHIGHDVTIEVVTLVPCTSTEISSTASHTALRVVTTASRTKNRVVLSGRQSGTTVFHNRGNDAVVLRGGCPFGGPTRHLQSSGSGETELYIPNCR